MKLFETNFSKEKPELIAAPVLLSTFKFQLSNNLEKLCELNDFPMGKSWEKIF